MIDWIRNFLDISVISFIIYHLLLLVKGTRGWQMTLGVTSLFLFYYLIDYLGLRTVEWLFANFFTYFIFALIVIFQAEIRRGLAHLGGEGFFNRFTSSKSREQLGEIVLAATALSKHGIGALMVVERNIGLKNYIERGIKLDAYLTYDLLVTIFNPKSPLHDGAVIIQGNHVAAAACFLPLTLDPALSKKLGSRHRAAIGIAEETDAVAVLISEETGEISTVIEWKITGDLDAPRLLNFLQKAFKAPVASLSGKNKET